MLIFGIYIVVNAQVWFENVVWKYVYIIADFQPTLFLSCDEG